MPATPYPSFAGAKRLDGMRIGVIREYMDRKLFNKADEESIAAAEKAIADLQKLGATIVDPGRRRGAPAEVHRQVRAAGAEQAVHQRFPEAFPVDDGGKPAADHIASLVDMFMNPSRTPAGVTLRSLGGGGSPRRVAIHDRAVSQGARRREHQDA